MEKRFMNAEELAAYIGVSQHTIYWWVATRKVPHSKLGKLVRFDSVEIEEWLKSNSRALEN